VILAHWLLAVLKLAYSGHGGSSTIIHWDYRCFGGHMLEYASCASETISGNGNRAFSLYHQVLANPTSAEMY
jgi:hypothetical protein